MAGIDSESRARAEESGSIQPGFGAAFQVRYILAMIGGSLLGSLMLYLYLARGLGESYFDSLITIRNLEQALPSSILISSALQVLLILILTVIINLFVLHKIAGPVYRYEQSLQKIIEGDLRGEVRTRKGDQLKSMGESLNFLQASLRRIYLDAGALRENAERVLSGPKGGNEQMRDLATRAGDLRRHLGEDVDRRGSRQQDMEGR